MSRKNQLGFLIILSAATMAIPYAIQGALSTGSAPDAIHPYIYLADRIAWAIRALVEGLVIGYIARTHANSKLQGFVLWVLKFALITLIAITLGPVLYATSTGLPIQQTMTDGWHRFWAYALASYMPLMVLGAAYAYKTQPADIEVQHIDSEEFAELEHQLATTQRESEEMDAIIAEGNEHVKKLNGRIADMQNELVTVQAMVKTAGAWELLNATAKAVWIAEHTNGARPPASHLAKALGVATSTISRAYESVDKRS